MRSVKHEKIFLEEFETVPKLLAGLKEYFEFYKFERPHQSFSRKPPAEMYRGEEVTLCPDCEKPFPGCPALEKNHQVIDKN